MADPKKEETPAAPDALAALTQLVAALGAKVDGCMATIGKLAMPAPAAAATGDDKELRASVERMTLAFTQQGDQLKAIIAANAQAKKERALLGLVPSDRVRLGSAPAEDIEAAVAKQKNYIDLVRDVQTSEKLGAGAAHAKVRASKEGNEAYQMHLAAKGVVRMVA